MREHQATIIIGITTIVFVGAILAWAFLSTGRISSASLTEVTDKFQLEDKVQLAHISIATGENYYGNRIRVISGVVRNTSDKPIRRVEVKMMFTDYGGKPIQQT